MRFIDYLLVAFRNIRRQKTRSALTIFAVVIGVMSVTIMLALVTGAKGFFIKQVEANGTLQQVAISQKTDLESFDRAGDGGNCSDCVKLSDDIKTKIESINHVQAVARVSRVGQLESVTYEGKKLNAERSEASDANGVFKRVVAAGRDFNAEDKEGVITITKEYADKFGFKGNYEGIVGKKVTLTTRAGYTGVGADIQKPQNIPGQQNNPQMAPATEIQATVIGVIVSDNGALIGLPLEWANAMNINQRYEMENTSNQCTPGKPCNPTTNYKLVVEDFTKTNGYTSMVAKVDNPKNASSVASEIKKLGIGAADAKSMIKSQLSIFNIIGLVLGVIGGIALMVAAIGVVNTMIMAILERTREIGVMRAVGAKRATVRRLFTTEAAMLGFMGGVIGVNFGFGLTKIANIFVNDQLASNAIAARDIITTPLWLVVTVIAIATFIGLIAGLGPAARAARLDPVEALRSE
ncbi:MAG: ABC transporter permease [Acidimicrobiia bacterium]